MRRRQVEYRISASGDLPASDWRSHDAVVQESDGSTTILGLDLGVVYDVRLRTVDDQTGEASEWVLWPGTEVERDSGVPPAPADVRTTKGDCLTWEMPMEVLDLRGFRVRHAPGVHGGWVDGWGTAEDAHEELVSAPPLILCRVPKGRRTFLVRAEDWDGNLSEPVTVVTDRGPIDDQEEFLLRTVDEAASGFQGGDVEGAPVPAPQLVASALVEASVNQPMFPSGIEPWMSLDPHAPMFPTDPEAPMFGETWELEAPWFGRSPIAPMFGDLYHWIEYVWSFTVHSCEGGVGAVLSIDCESSGVGWRLQYRVHHPQAWLSSNPFDPMFGAPTDPMFPEQPVKPWRPWPGRLLDAAVGRYDFRLLVPGGHEQAVVSRLAVTLSHAPRVRHVLGLPVTALGGSRVPPGDDWRKIIESRPQVLTVDAARTTSVRDKSGAKGPWLQVFDQDSGEQVDALVDVTLRGY